MVVYDLETFYTKRGIPFANIIQKLSKIQVYFIEIQLTKNLRNLKKIVLFSEEQIVLMEC